MAGLPSRPRTSFEVSRTSYETAFLSGARNPATPSVYLRMEFDHDDQKRALAELDAVYAEAVATIEDTWKKAD